MGFEALGVDGEEGYACPMSTPPNLRQPCPPGACNCGREHLAEQPSAAQRILLLTRQEEKRLLERLENLKDLEDLQRLQQRMYENLGIRVHIAPGFNEVRTMRGIVIELDEQPGLCRKTRQLIPAAIRRGLERNPQVAYRLLDDHDLLRGA
ncbi:hypothetical protein PAGU2196_12310 [Pseudomonas sp. PAGU 2196]|nr:hypothetical protein PAGU2196_12310 [Pseudomonas sp. PAGU 2196]